MKKNILIILFLCTIFMSFSEVKNENFKKIYTGIYLSDISGFDLNEGRFNADIYIWCKWLGDDEAPKIRFANGEIDTIEQIAKEKDGKWNSIRWHLQGTFRGTFNLQNFPFDKQNLNIIIELEDTAGKIEPDLTGSGMSKKFSITGWLYKPYFNARISENIYTSDFGSIEHEGEPYKTNAVIYSVNLSRPILPYLVKFILPIIIILLVSMGVFFISPEELEANMGLGITSLLTCVAFQYSLADSIPDVPYLITSDKFFIITYFVIFLNIIMTIITYNVYKKNKKFSKKLDAMSWKILGSLMIIGISLIFLTDIAIPQTKTYKSVEQKYEYSHETSKDELIYSVGALTGLNSYCIQQGLLTRGLYHTDKNGKKAHLIVKVPDLTNEYVRLLQNGNIIVKWQLKNGLKWGDGKPITADDLIFSIKLIKDNNRINILKIDKYTIDVEYKKRTRDIIEKFAIYPMHRFASITSPQKISTQEFKNIIFNLKNEDDKNLLHKFYKLNSIDEHYILVTKNIKIKKSINEILYKTDFIIDKINELLKSNPPPMDGPYLLEEFLKNDHATFTINPYFADKKPYIKKIKFKVSDDPVIDLIRKKEVDIIAPLSNETYKKLLDKPGINIFSDTSTKLLILQPDINIFPYNNKEFRQALLYALDREKISKQLYGKKAIATNSYRPKTAPDYNPQLNNYKYRPLKAKQIISKININKPIKLLIYEPYKNSSEWNAITTIKKNLENTGLKVDIEFIKSTVKLFKYGNHEGILFKTTYSQFDYYQKFFNVPYDLEISQAYKLFNDDILQLNNKFKNTMFIERQYSLSFELQEKFNELLPVLPISFSQYRYACNEKLKEWDPTGVEANIWWNIEYLYFE